MRKSKRFIYYYNLPTWFEDKGYRLDLPLQYRPNTITTLYYKEPIPSRWYHSSIEVKKWSWIPSLTSVIEAVKEFEKCQQVFKYH